VAFSLSFAPGLGLPPRVGARLARILGDIAEWLDALADESSYLKAVDGEIAELNLEGWRIEYRVHRKPRGIVVMSAWRQSEAA
jgi:hypothetical protein